ncbi:MAG: hypothetical protein KJZ86_03430 [Caldilineaceae bacterium]|nr:hypothetical protein [Caldilineaceae bacterium]HRJ41792.1 hypothetical protein [Caldilineaceae bacterium]
MLLQRLTDLAPAEIEPLLVESRAEGYNFVDRLVDDYADGSPARPICNECFVSPRPLFTV